MLSSCCRAGFCWPTPYNLQSQPAVQYQQVEQVKKLTGCVSQVTPSDHPFARSIIQETSRFRTSKSWWFYQFRRLTTNTKFMENIPHFGGAIKNHHLSIFFCTALLNSINSKEPKLAGHWQRAGSGKKSTSQVKREDGSLGAEVFWKQRVVCLEDRARGWDPHLGYDVVFVKGE